MSAIWWWSFVSGRGQQAQTTAAWTDGTFFSDGTTWFDMMTHVLKLATTSAQAVMRVTRSAQAVVQAHIGASTVGDIEAVNPAAEQITIMVGTATRQTWDGYGYGLGVAADAFATQTFYQTHQVALFDELGTKAIRLHNPQEAGFVANYKPLCDFAISKGVDRILATGYVWRNINSGGDYTPTALADGVHVAIVGGIPITHVCLQNEPDGHEDNHAPTSDAVDLVADHQELRNQLNALGHQVGGPSPVVVIGLEWAHFGSRGETEYDLLNAAGAIPSVVGFGAGHCYKDCPANGLYDSRWLTKGLPLWSTETGNAGSPNCQARFVAALNHGAAVEMMHIGATSSTTGDLSQFLVTGGGAKRDYHSAIRVISSALPRGTVFRLCQSSDRPPGLNTTFADRMIRDGGQQNPRIQVAAGVKPNGKWVLVAVNATEGSDTPASHLGAHYGAALLQMTATLPGVSSAKAFATRRASISGTLTDGGIANMRSDGMIRWTLAAGETIAMEEPSGLGTVVYAGVAVAYGGPRLEY